jgi:hypothetical protein
VARGIGPSIIILGPVAHHSFLSSGVQYSVSWVRSFFRMGERGKMEYIGRKNKNKIKSSTLDNVVCPWLF